MSIAETIVKEVVLGLRKGPGGLYFAVPPRFIEARIRCIESTDEQRATIASLSSLGFTLHQQQNVEASRSLMTVVDDIAKELGNNP